MGNRPGSVGVQVLFVYSVASLAFCLYNPASFSSFLSYELQLFHVSFPGLTQNQPEVLKDHFKQSPFIFLPLLTHISNHHITGQQWRDS